MHPPLKYQPYHGYGPGKPWHHYFRSRDYPRRVRTRSDWRWNVVRQPCEQSWDWARNQSKHVDGFCNECGRVHCLRCDCLTPWKKDHGNCGSVYEKTKVHRLFRRRAKALIYRELTWDDGVSHNFFVDGGYLD